MNRPLAEFGGRELYQSDRKKIAALIHSINSAHVFRDGNKRTSVAALVVLLDRNGWRFNASDQQLTDLLVAVATPAPPFNGKTAEAIREITAWIRAHTEKKSSSSGVVSVIDFLDRCKSVGGSWREAGPSFLLTGTKGSIRISRATHELTEIVARNYLSKVGLTEAHTGVPRDEFLDGRPKNLALVRRYREALKLLAEHDRSDD